MDELFETDDDPEVPEGGFLRMLPIINRRGLHARASAKRSPSIRRLAWDRLRSDIHAENAQ